VADRIAMLMDGRIRAMGNPAELKASADPAVQEFLERDLTVPVHH
jgi:ABC-type transporter Mla maintaining outer membrane lipid asymmetry ATPase subunit MlaF